jgi:hypothetical protein
MTYPRANTAHVRCWCLLYSRKRLRAYLLRSSRSGIVAIDPGLWIPGLRGEVGKRLGRNTTQEIDHHLQKVQLLWYQ